MHRGLKVALTPTLAGGQSLAPCLAYGNIDDTDFTSLFLSHDDVEPH